MSIFAKLKSLFGKPVAVEEKVDLVSTLPTSKRIATTDRAAVIRSLINEAADRRSARLKGA